MSETFRALADPTRRQIVEMLRDGDRDAGSIADEFSISKPAISRHLKVLREASLVAVRPDAQRRVYTLSDEGFAELAAWIARYRSFWSRRLDALEGLFEEAGND